ncbi:muramidase [Phormidesmis sp. 146-20]
MSLRLECFGVIGSSTVLDTSSQPMANPESKPDGLEQFVGNLLARSVILLGVIFLVMHMAGKRPSSWFADSATGAKAPLVMRGGDPYIRALMRTISASESNVRSPYTVIYGGDHISNLSHHPDRCVTIVAGPNIGNCSTAAGRYQFITTTWIEQAQRYHPAPPRMFFWQSYSFEPEYQDQVVYQWLSDSQAWGVDLRQLLKKGRINTVLQRLSGTWTSLGYGIEDNANTAELPSIYKQMLREELGQAASRPLAGNSKRSTP